jgi:general secretion pathway protein E
MTSRAARRRLGQILLEAGTISAGDLEAALARAQKTEERIGEALIAMGAVTRHEVLAALALQYELPFLFREEFPTALPIVKNLSAKYLRQYTVCPVAIEGSTVTLATADPTNPLVLDDFRQSLGLEVELCVASPSGILEAIERTYGNGASTQLQKIVDTIGRVEAEGEGPEDVGVLRDLASEAPVVRLVNLLLEEAVKAEASDIHIEPFEETLRVRYRIDGLLYDQESPPRRLQAALGSRVKLMAEMNIAERRLPQDGRIRLTLGARRVDIRVSTIPTIHGESIVMRLLDRSSVFVPFDRLGFHPATAQAFARLIRRPHGILLVTGPTGSGKTTTLYAGLDKINLPDKKIITVEDPVEYQLEGVNQIPVRAKIGLSFATGLRHIVRQDPDVIMVGEIRDLETAEIAIQAALTGHLVLSTLHTNDAPSAVTRLQDMGAEPYLVSSVLDGVLAQRLVRRICPHCTVTDHPHPADLLAIGVEEPPAVQIYRGTGCVACRGTGYRGRTGIYELFTLDEQLRSLVMTKAPTGDLRRYAMAKGMVTLREDGWAKVCAGITTVEEILRVTQEDVQPATTPSAAGVSAPVLPSVGHSRLPRGAAHGSGEESESWDVAHPGVQNGGPSWD